MHHGDYGVNYTGLTFGTHSSDAHCYLYNKSFELLTQGDKPWIRERWSRMGLDVREVWRLEVSIKSGGLKFKDKQTKEKVEVVPEMVSRHARKNGMLDNITLTVESGGIGGFPVSGEAFGAMIGAASVYDMANQFDLYDNGGLDICFMGALEVDKQGNVNAHRGPGAFAGIGGFANITANSIRKVLR